MPPPLEKSGPEGGREPEDVGVGGGVITAASVTVRCAARLRTGSTRRRESATLGVGSFAGGLMLCRDVPLWLSCEAMVSSSRAGTKECPQAAQDCASLGFTAKQ